jgi:hypothetical protein
MLTSIAWACNVKTHAYLDLWVWERTGGKSIASTIIMQIFLSLSLLLPYGNHSPSSEFELWSTNNVWVAANWWEGSWSRQRISVPYDTDILYTMITVWLQYDYTAITVWLQYDYTTITVWLQYDYSMITSTNTYLYHSTTGILIMTEESALDLGNCLR